VIVNILFMTHPYSLSGSLHILLSSGLLSGGIGGGRLGGGGGTDRASVTLLTLFASVTLLATGTDTAATGGWGVVHDLDEKIEKAFLIDAWVGGFLDNFFAQGRHRVYIKNKICF
jgi:hypothetical protein